MGNEKCAKLKESKRHYNSDSDLELFDDDEMLPMTPMSSQRLSKTKALAQKGTSLNMPPELASVFSNLQKYKENMNGISNENEDVLKRVAAKIESKHEKVKRKKHKNESPTKNEEEANRIDSEFSNLHKTLDGLVDHKEFSRLVNLLKCKLDSNLPSSVLELLKESTIKQIDKFLLRTVQKEEKSFQLYLYLILLFKLKLSLKSHCLTTTLFRFNNFCRSYTQRLEPMSLLTCLHFCIRLAVRKCNSLDQLNCSYAQLMPLFDQVFRLLSRRKTKDFNDPHITGLIMFSLFGYFVLINSADLEDQKQYLFGDQHRSIGKLFECILKFSEYDLDAAFGHFSNVLYNYLSGLQSLKEALNLWLQLIKVLPSCLTKYNWHLLYMAMKQISDEGQYWFDEEKTIRTQADVLNLLSQIMPILDKPSRDPNFSEVNHLVYMVYFVLKTFPTAQDPKELLQLVKHLNMIKPEQVNSKNRMMLIEMESVLTCQVEQCAIADIPPTQLQQ